MNLQQLEYLVALDEYRQFSSAAEHCSVTQPTLSMMLQKLEKELDVEIFERKNKHLEPTLVGQKIINQARISIGEIHKMKEIVENEKEELRGSFGLGIIPTLAPYLIPDLISFFGENYPSLEINFFEQETDVLIENLRLDKIDMFIAATPLDEDNFYEIPLYYESFYAYFSPLSNPPSEKLKADTMPSTGLWVLEQGHCLRDQVLNFCKSEIPYNHTFEAGSIDTLLRILEKNEGYTIIPELHIPLLYEEQMKNLIPIEPPAIREVSIVIKKNFIKERLINAMAEAIKNIIKPDMLDARLKKYSIKLR